MLGYLRSALGKRSLAFQITLLVAVTAFPLLFLSFLTYDRLVSNERENFRKSVLLRAKTIAALAENEVDTHTAILATLATTRNLQEENLVAFSEQARQALELVPGAWIAVSAPSGELLLTTLTPGDTPLPHHVAPAVIKRAFGTRRPQVGDLVFGPVSQQWTAFVEVPVFKNNEPLYSLSISLLPARFRPLIDANAAPGEVLGLVDRNRKFVGRTPDHETRVGTLASEGWRAAMTQRPEGWVETKTLEGVFSFMGYAPTSHGWTVGIAVSDEAIKRPLNAIFWSSALIAGGLTALSLVFAALLARNLSRGAATLARAAQDLGEGKIVAPQLAPFAEAAVIGSSLAYASTELARSAERINKHQNELEAQVEERTADLRAESARRAESDRLLRQVQKMDSIGQLTGGIAHDFNNMLTVVIGSLDMLQRRASLIENTESLNRLIDAARQGARNAAKLTHRLLAFSRQQALEPVVVNLNALVASLSDLLARTMGETVRVETVSGAGLWPVFADANQIENALVNLSINARDAMPSGGRLTIETGNAYLDEAYASQFGDVSAGQYAMISVSDTGNGIPKDQLEKIFEPFFTTKEPGKGTGLGLAMVHGFVKQSGGHIRIYSEVNSGTSVKIYLPRYIESAVAPAAARAELQIAVELPRAIAGETILMVEDDAGVRSYAIDALEDLGYRVLVASNGPEALDILSKADRIDLLFSDVVLPDGMNGREVATAAVAERPDLLVLFTTGYTRNAIVHHGRLDAGVNLLQKPYTQRDLASKIRFLLDSKT